MDRVDDFPGLEATECHLSLCGTGTGDPPGLGECSGRWCSWPTEHAVYDTYSSGDIAVSFDGEIRVDTTRGGACPGDGES